MHIHWRWILRDWYHRAVCSFFFFIHCSYMPSQELLYAFRNCLSCKLEQILTIYNSSKHSLLNNLYNSVEAVVISTTSSTFLHSMYRFNNDVNSVPCCTMGFYPQPTSLPVNYPTQKRWQRVYFQSSRYWWWDQV